MRRAAGFTILELLITAAILITLLASLGGVLISALRAHETNRAVTESSARLHNAVETMRYDLGLAGYCADPAVCSLGGPGLEIEVEDDDAHRVVRSITSRYEEDRFAPGVVEVTYRVADGRLLRLLGGTEQEVASGIDRIVLLGYRSSESTSPTRQYARPPDETLTGVDLRLEYRREGSVMSEELTVLLRNAL